MPPGPRLPAPACQSTPASPRLPACPPSALCPRGSHRHPARRPPVDRGSKTRHASIRSGLPTRPAGHPSTAPPALPPAAPRARHGPHSDLSPPSGPQAMSLTGSAASAAGRTTRRATGHGPCSDPSSPSGLKAVSPAGLSAADRAAIPSAVASGLPRYPVRRAASQAASAARDPGSTSTSSARAGVIQCAAWPGSVGGDRRRIGLATQIWHRFSACMS